ncbi:MAG TPA: YgiQ family radical SAM protein [bacterium]|nr:YgiQ family radical SAM protein [bacterium]
MNREHLPVDREQARVRGWNELDVVIVTGDADVDHPSFPAALLGRVLAAADFRVGIIARPDPHDVESVKRLGRPRLFFAVTAGALDSMVANYTALKRRRSDDPYAPDGRAGGRPDRALTVYGNLLRRAYGKAAFIVAGGLEASLRRFAHYDYWSDSVRRSLLMDCGADILVHGMGEGPIVAIARRLADLIQEIDAPDPAQRLAVVRDVPGVVYRVPLREPEPSDAVALPAAEKVAADIDAHLLAFRLTEKHHERCQWQNNGSLRVIANPPWPALSGAELDRIFSLPFTRDAHPRYAGARIPALEQVRFSVTAHRGCFGGCAFCSIGAHQGKIVQSRSADSVLAEVERIAAHPAFRGTINDLGGPTANMYGLRCLREKPCDRPSCLWPQRCPDLHTDHGAYVALLEQARRVKGVKHLFVTTGVRTDLAVLDEPFIATLAKHHTSGHLKIAPEHVCPAVLDLMRKTDIEHLDRFLELYARHSQHAGKEQYVLPYLMAAHPGSRLTDMIDVALYLRQRRLRVEQCQIFTPTPGTMATVMYATGKHPLTGEAVFVERDTQHKQMQKALILAHLPENASLVHKALRLAKREDLAEILLGASPRSSKSSHRLRRE